MYMHLNPMPDQLKLRTSVTGLNPYSTRGFFGHQTQDLYSWHPASVRFVSADAKPADGRVIADAASYSRMDQLKQQ